MALVFKLEEDFEWNCGKKQPEDLNFLDKNGYLRMQILKDGTIIIKKGYVWDGCTPKIWLELCKLPWR